MSNFAMIFPGQGSQSLGMLKDLSEKHPIIKSTFDKASNVLGYDLWDVVLNGPADKLNETHITQPALLTASYALFNLWNELKGQEPSYMAGHSLGEYSALVCAGVIDFEDVVKLVELRGRLMQQAVPAGIGAMYAIIGLDNQAIIEACKEAANDQIVSPVNFNSPGQVVIAGHKEAVEKAAVICKEKGAKRALPLSVSVPSHCALMKPAADELSLALQKIEFKSPKCSVINNVNVKVETDANEIKAALVAQLYSPVRWTEIIEKMSQKKITKLVEVGPGKVLAGLTKRIVDNISCYNSCDLSSFDAALEQISK